MLPNRASRLLSVDTEPAILNAPPLQLHRVADRNANRNHELDEERCDGDSLCWKGLRNLGEESFDFLLPKRLRLQPLFVFLRQFDGLQCSEQVVEILTAARAEKTGNVLLGLLASGCPPYLVPAPPKLDYVRRSYEGLKQLRPGRHRLVELVELKPEFLDSPGRDVLALFGTDAGVYAVCEWSAVGL